MVQGEESRVDGMPLNPIGIKRSILHVFLLLILILPAWAISPEVLTAFWQFQRAIYYAQDLTSLYPYLSSLEVSNLRAITDPEIRRKKLIYYQTQYLEDPVFTEEKAVAQGTQLSGTGIAVINKKRHKGHFQYILKKENGRWIMWSRQFVSTPE
jgi:hypothetical protein